MNDPNEPDPLALLRTAWLRPTDAAPTLTLEELQAADRDLRRSVRRMNIQEWVAGVFLVPWCLYSAYRAERTPTAVGMLLLATSGLFICYVIFKRSRVPSVSPSAPTREFYEEHVGALTRRAELLESVWRWYLLPFVPGIAVVYIDAVVVVLGRPVVTPRAYAVLGFTLLVAVAVYLVVGVVNRRAARKIRRRIETLRGHDSGGTADG